LYLDTGFVIAPVISNSLLIGSKDMAFIDHMPQLSTAPIYTDMSITTGPQSSTSQMYPDMSITTGPQSSTSHMYTDMSITTDQHPTETSILEQVIN